MAAALVEWKGLLVSMETWHAQMVDAGPSL